MEEQQVVTEVEEEQLESTNNELRLEIEELELRAAPSALFAVQCTYED